MKRSPAIVLGWILLLLMAPAAAQDDIRIAAVALFNGKAVLEVDGRRHTLAVGESTPEGVELVSADSERAVVAFAGERLELSLDGRIAGSFVRGNPARQVRLVPGSNGHYYVDGKINGNGVRFVVDTGATHVVINRDQARRMGLSYRVDGRKGAVETASGTSTAYYLRFREVHAQAISLKDVDGVVVDGSFPSVALLGQSFLNRLDLRREGAVLELQER